MKHMSAVLMLGCAAGAFAQDATTRRNWDNFCSNAVAQPLVEESGNPGTRTVTYYTRM
jgi:hypothetical protein